MDNEQNKINPEVFPEPISTPEEAEIQPEAPSVETEILNVPEQLQDGQEVLVENGQVFQMPAHDDSNTDVSAHVQHIAPLPEEEKLWQLKLLARDKGVEKAVEVVKKMNDPWLEDKFHDDIMDDADLRAQLESLGKIEKL